MACALFHNQSGVVEISIDFVVGWLIIDVILLGQSFLELERCHRTLFDLIVVYFRFQSITYTNLYQ